MNKSAIVRSIVIVTVTLVLLAGFTPAHTPALAQSGGQLQIHGVDTDYFPDTCIWVSAIDSTGNAAAGLSANQFAVFEDGVEVATEVEQWDVGLQLAIVFDASGSMSKEAATGKTRIDAVKGEVAKLLTSGQYLGKEMKDSIALLVPEGDGISNLIPGSDNQNAAFDQDGGRVYNRLYPYQIADTEKPTPLSDQIVETIRLLQSHREPGNPRQAILVFSDGIDEVSATITDDPVSLAQDAGIPIYTVLMSSAETDGARNLKRYSTMTMGAYYHYAAEDSLSPLFYQLAALRNQYSVWYRSNIDNRADHQIRVDWLDSSGRTISSSSTSIGVGIQPPAVSIIEPPANTIFERITDDPFADPTLVEPVDTLVRIEWAFPDGYVREIRSVNYILNGVVLQTYTEPPFDEFVMGISHLDSGTHSIEVEVIDELGMTARSAARTFDTRVVIPDKPTPTPPPDLKAPAVSILSPAAGTRFDRISDDPNVDPTTVEPTALAMQIAWDWPDGLPRLVQKVEYILDGAVMETRTEEPFDQAIISIADLGTGQHSLQVQVTDVEGLEGESQAIPIEVNLSIREPIFTTERIIAGVAALLALAALIFAIIVYKKRPAWASVAVENAKQTVIRAIRGRGQQVASQSDAYLVVKEGSASHTGPIYLDGMRENFLGRDETKSNITFPLASHVSGKHCVIRRKGPKKYTIEDVGSANGTWVNDTELTLDIGEHYLSEGDEIDLGASVLLVFHLKDREDGGQSGVDDETVLAGNPESTTIRPGARRSRRQRGKE